MGLTIREWSCAWLLPNAKKCWLIVKLEPEQAAREVFRDTAINVTIEGRKHLGTALGSRSFLEEYVGEKVAELLEPLERAINEVLIQAVTDHTVSKVEGDLLGFPVRMGGLGFTDPVVTSSSEYEASIEVTNPLVRRIVEQEHQPPLRCLRNSNTATEHTKTSK